MVQDRNFLQEIEQSTNKAIHRKDDERVNKIISKIISGGFDSLHIVSDFDRTITKQCHNGKKHTSSFGMMAHCPSASEDYLEKEEALCKKYMPKENDFSIPHEQRVKLMEQWWKETEEILIGMRISRAEINDTARKLGSSLREGIDTIFGLLKEKNVPVLVFSAGMGDMVECVLDHHNLFLPNVKVVSNFLKYDNSGNILGFKQEPIQVFNKNEDHLAEFGYHELVENRNNIILMGDSVGDGTMVGHESSHKNVLKIGFLNNEIESQNNLSRYLDVFDIVLENDDTMNVLGAILKYMS